MCIFSIFDSQVLFKLIMINCFDRFFAIFQAFLLFCCLFFTSFFSFVCHCCRNDFGLMIHYNGNANSYITVNMHEQFNTSDNNAKFDLKKKAKKKQKKFETNIRLIRTEERSNLMCNYEILTVICLSIRKQFRSFVYIIRKRLWHY